jgi:hypothetical protein
MKHLICIIAFTAFISCTSESQKLPAKQKRIVAFIKKYQDSVAAAPDSTTKNKIFLDMWNKHVKFIQDTLNISHNTKDTFVFNRAIVRQSSAKDGRMYLHLFLDNGNYGSEFFYADDKNFRESDYYKMIKSLKTNTPVIAVGTLTSFSLPTPNVAEGIKKVLLDLHLDTVYSSDGR